MDLSITEQFLLLAMHPEKPRYLIGGPAIQAGLIGAILLDLAIEEKILIEQGHLRCKSTLGKLSQAHQQVLTLIHNSEKERSIKLWIRKMIAKSGNYRKIILYDLKNKGMIRLEKKRFLWVPYLKAYLVRKNDRTKLINTIRDILIYNKKPDNMMASLLGLVHACQMQGILSKKSPERKLFKTKLNEIMKSDEIAGSVSKVVKEMQAAVAASVAITASTSAAAH